MATISIIFKIILDCLEQKMEEGGNLVEINFSFENKKIIKLLQKIFIIVCINSKINHVFERKSDYVRF